MGLPPLIYWPLFLIHNNFIHEINYEDNNIYYSNKLVLCNRNYAYCVNLILYNEYLIN